MESNPLSAPNRRRFLFVTSNQWSSLTLGSLLALLNFLTVPVATNLGVAQAQLLGIAAGGAVGAQLGLVAAWSTFSSARFLVRMSVAAAIGLTLYSCWALGLLMVVDRVPGPPVEVIPFILSNCPLVFLAAQAPLVAARTWLGWEIAKPGEAPVGSYRRPTQLRDIILGTVAASVALTIMRLGLLVAPEGNREEQMLMVSGVVAGCTAAASTATVLPLLYFVFGVRQIAMGVVLGGVWFLTAVTTQVTMLEFVAGDVSQGMMEACVLFTGTFALVMAVGLLPYRAQGYRLRWQSSFHFLPGSRDAPVANFGASKHRK